MFRKRFYLVTMLFLTGISNAFPIVPFLESGLPQGDYLNQCSECAVVDNRLSCICNASTGHSFPRTLDLSLCSMHLVSVKKDRLYCEEGLTVIPEEVEESDSVSINVLQEDVDGLLPRGNYRSYCQDCSVNNNVLECSCKMDGWIFTSWYKSSLPLLSCNKKNEVVFMGGQLFCSMEELLEFHGLNKVNTHDNSCSNCYFSGSTLKCQCNKTRCGWSGKDFKKEMHINKYAYLDNAYSCIGEINNCNGKLRCGECWAYDYFDQGEWKRPYYGNSPKYGYCYPNAPW